VNVSAAVTQLRTTDLEASIRFYTTVMGFALAFRFGDFYAGIRAGNHLFHLKRVDTADPSIEFVRNGEHFHLYFETDDLAAVADELRGRGVRLIRDLHRTEWQTIEIVLEDDQGHTLHVAQPLSS
jgi:catechol 2,3-dioxygenase-like lactoylglutathione lyase family enzyme